MNKEQAFWLLHGVTWAHGEGHGCPELYEAARALIRATGLTRDEARMFDDGCHDPCTSVANLAEVWD